MRQLSRNLAGVTLALLVTFVAAGAELVAQQAGASGGRARVLVAVFHTDASIDDDFGQDVAEDLRERISDFDLLTAVDEDEIDDTLDEFDLEARGLDLVSWRQLAGRMNAQLVIWGQVTPAGGGGGNQVAAVFVDAQQGEQTEVPQFTVPSDEGEDAETAGQRIAQALNQHVEFLRSRINCQDYLASSQYEDAARNCDRALEINPQSAQALFLRGRISMEQENWEEARRYLSQVVEQDPSNEDALNSLAYANAQLGNMERANELYQEYLQFNPDDQDVRLSVAYNLANAGGYSGAMEVIQAGLERDSTSAALWKYLGDVAIQQGSQSGSAQLQGGTVDDTSAVRTAIDAYQHYVQFEADSALDANIYKNLVAAHLKLGNTQAAAEQLDRALETMADDPSLWSLRADLMAQQENFGQAVASMDSVLSLDPDRPDAHFKKGVLALRGGMDQVAMDEFQLAVDEGGSDPEGIANAIFARGYQNHFQNERYAQAARMFETALEFTSTNQIEFFAGFAHYRAGEAIDRGNEEQEACQPAREALRQFEQVLPHLNRAGDYQAGNQQQVRQAVDVQLYRQEQIIKKSCG